MMLMWGRGLSSVTTDIVVLLDRSHTDRSLSVPGLVFSRLEPVVVIDRDHTEFQADSIHWPN
jgi:hypothetical protein